MNKTKPISKQPHQSKKPKKPVTDEQGDPLIKNLSDFVTSIKIVYSSKPIYTGGRVIAMHDHLYSTCNQQISVYSFEKGAIIDKIQHKNEEIVNFSVCPLQKYIITFTQNAMVRVIVLQTKKVLHTLKMNGTFANDIQFSPDGRHVAFALGNTVHIYTFQTMKRTHTYNPTNSKFIINKIQWHPSVQKLQIVTCDMDKNIAVFDYILNKVIAVSQANDGGNQFCLANNGENIVAINNKQIKVYEMKTMQVKNVIETEEYMQTIFYLDGHLYMGGQQTDLYSIKLSSSNLKVKHHPKCTDNGIAKIMSNGKTNQKKLLVVSSEQNISILKPLNKSLQHQGMIVGYNDEIIDIKHSKTEQSPYFLLVTNSNNLKLMNKNTHRLQHLIQGHTNIVLCADYFHPYIISAGKDNTIKLWKIIQNQTEGQNIQVKLLANYHGHTSDVVSVVALPKSKTFATVSQDFTIKLWSIVTDSPQPIQIKSAIRTAIAHQKSINAIRASNNEQLLATCSQDKSIKIWDQHLSNTLTLNSHKRGVWDAAFHPVQNILVSAGGDGMLKGWNLQTGECQWSIGQGPALIRCGWLYYNQVVTGSFDGIVKIWDIRKQTSLAYDKHEGKIWALDIITNNNNQKGKKVEIMSGATDSTYHIWHDNTSQTKSNIMHENQIQEQQRILYDQYLNEGRFCEAAVLAFKAGYIKMFSNVVEKMGQKIDGEATVQERQDGGLMLSEEDQGKGEVGDEEFVQMVKKLKQIDFGRLLIVVQTMASTVKMYKMANKLLFSALKTSTFLQLSQLNTHFSLPDTSQTQNIQNFNQKKTGFVKWLETMIGYQQKHQTRLQKYIIGTHWIQHKQQMSNPFA